MGLLFGSFYNVVGMRLPNNKSIIFPGSHCEKCNHKLSWYENIPLASYILLGGKCKNCHTKISIWYPAIELFTGMLFLISYYTFGLTPEFAIAVIISSLVSIIFVSDINYYIIKSMLKDGDFRSKECVEILKESDIVVTNPPFSLFVPFVNLIIEYDKKFLIIGNCSIIHFHSFLQFIFLNEMRSNCISFQNPVNILRILSLCNIHVHPMRNCILSRF